jgi:triacylglycerol lipase
MPGMRSLRLGLCSLLLAGLTVGAASAVSAVSADPLPPLPTAPTDPPGANDWSCEPTAARPVPVVLVHGTFGDRKHLLEALSKDLSGAGFCVFSLDYGNRATQDVTRSAAELATYVDRVLAATGAARVSLVGHSQGGMMPRYFIKHLGGDRVVDDLVGIAPSNHGTSLLGNGENPLASLVGVLCRSCQQQAAGSPFLTALNSGDETPGPVSYTQITTRYDEVVIPHTSGHLADGPLTTNLTVQDLCPHVYAEHVTLPQARVTRSIVLHALSVDGPARASYRPGC